MTPLVNGAEVRRLRAAFGFSTADLAELVGSDRHSISKIESGDTASPHAVLLVRIAAALGTSVEMLINPAAVAGGPWQSKIWSQVGETHAEHVREAFDGCRRTVAATRTAESFLIPHEMLAWAERDRMRAEGKPEGHMADWLAFYKRHARVSINQRHDAGNESLTILRKDFLHDAAAMEGGWVDLMDRRLGELGGKVKLALATETDWKKLERGAAKLIGGGRWNKLLAVDDTFAVWWSTPEHYRWTRDRGIVVGLARVMTEAADPLRADLHDTHRMLERIALRKKR